MLFLCHWNWDNIFNMFFFLSNLHTFLYCFFLGQSKFWGSSRQNGGEHSSTSTVQLESNINKALRSIYHPAMEFNLSQRFEKQTIFPQPRQEVASVNKV